MNSLLLNNFVTKIFDKIIIFFHWVIMNFSFLFVMFILINNFGLAEKITSKFKHYDIDIEEKKKIVDPANILPMDLVIATVLMKVIAPIRVGTYWVTLPKIL